MFLIGDRWLEEPNEPALLDIATGSFVSYGILGAQVQLFGEQISAEKKKLVFLFCRNDLASVVAYMAAVESGHAVALIESDLDQEFISRLIGIYLPDIIIGSESKAEWMQIIPGSVYSCSKRSNLEVGLWVRNTEHALPVNDDLSLLLSTSGTTGSPKLVRLTRHNVESNAQAIIETLGIGHSERAITSLPIHYSYGLSVINSHLACGASVTLTNESILSRDFWKIFSDQECSSFAGVPFSYQMMDRIGFARFSLPSLRTLTQAGGKMNEPLTRKYYEYANEHGAKLMIMYGQTEATARMACLPYEQLPDRMTSAGHAIPGGRFAILQDSTETRDPAKIGEIIYYGPNVMMGYAESRSDLSLGDELSGRLATGDLGYLDENGNVYLTGRLKRIAKVAGSRINLDEIQAFFEQFGPCAVIEKEGKLEIFTVEEKLDDMKVYAKSLARKLKIHHAVFAFHTIDSLPLKASGKIDYSRLEGPSC